MKLALLRRVLAAALCAVAPLAPAQNVVRAPHYGETLFEFFQDRTFDAITGLMVSQHFGRIAPHDDEAEVLRGGMLLTYGLHEEAGAVFAQLIERGAAPPVRDRAWFFLAKLRYQRGMPAAADEALARVVGPLPGGLEDERTLLKAQLRMAQGDYAGAAAILSAVPPQAAASAYARFNLGVALVKSGDAAHGSALLDELGRAPATGEEARSLRDRANVALGFAALQEKRPAQARDALQRVRLVGAESNKALLGFGWAAAELKNPKDALVPWTELAGRDSADAAVLEARIAVPYALAELGAYGQALDGYNGAVALYDRERVRLDESIAAIRAGALVGALLERNPNDSMSGFASIHDVPAMPHAAHLAQLFAGHEFQEAFKNLRDLQFLERNLHDWQSRLGVFDDMLANRRQAYAERLPKVLQRSSELNPALRQQRRDALADELVRAEQQTDSLAFVDERERALLEQVERLRAMLAAHPDAALAERLRRVSSALQTRREAYAERLPEVRTGSPSLAALQQRHAALADELVRAEQQGNTLAFVDERERALLERIERVRASLEAHPDPELAERLRRASGALIWQLARDYPERLWDAKKSLRASAVALAEAHARDAALARAQQDEPARFERFGARIAELTARLRSLTPHVAALGAEQQGQLQESAVAELDRQKQRLDVYAAQARLAIAQLHDQAQLASRSDHDAKR